jgi:glycosyltransferase involved in cell wall biosynthesis
MTARRPRVAILQRYLPHYRRSFFERLAKANPDLDIRLYHGGELGGGPAEAPLEGPISETLVRNVRILPLVGYDLVVQRSVVRQILRDAPDLVVLEGTFGVLTNSAVLVARRLRGQRTVYWSAGWDRPGVTGVRHKLKTTVIRSLIGLADGYIAYGSAARDYLARHGADAARVTIAQNTIDVESIAASAPGWSVQGARLKEQLGLDGHVVITYVGGIAPLKRVSVLVDAYRRLQQQIDRLALLIVGDGPEATEIRARSHDLPGVHFAGAVVEGVEAYIAAGDVFVLPGTGGLALNQAMALGKPLVATIADGTERDLVIPGRNGYLARVDDPEDLAKCLGRVLADPLQAVRMGAASTEIVIERASMASMVGAFSSAMRAALMMDAP